MISVMSDDYKFDRRPDALEDSRENGRISEVGCGNSSEKCSNLEVADEVRNSSSQFDSGASVSEVEARFPRNGESDEAVVSSTEEFRVRVCSESDGGGVGNSVGSIDFGVKREISTDGRFDYPINRLEAQNEHFRDPVDRYCAQHDREEHRSGGETDSEKRTGFGSQSLLSEFDEYVAAERHGGVRAGVSRDLGYGLEVGDMVWGKVKSHPWWPGHIYNEAFASPQVRHTKREGHVLVAFFGDSSYGWFEPAELIPFDTNFSEKSRQTNSRTFLKAVEEAVDEASRRCGLGLACKCRSPNNFRPTNVQGYFSVDVPDYEPGGVYSNIQIRKARNSFKPSETLAFIKLLAFSPHGGDHRSISFIKHMATIFAYRRAVFEQYDETYAQAFGVQPIRPSHSQAIPFDQPVREPPRAPLSGPLRIAEALGGGKNSAKSVKVKDNSKKDRYLLKRRDEPSNSVQLAYGEETSDAAGHYVFQKRASAVSVAPQISDECVDAGFISRGEAASTSDAKEVVVDQAQPHGSGLASQVSVTDAKPYLEKGKESSQEMGRSVEQDDHASKTMCRSDLSGERPLPSVVDETSQPRHLEGETSIDAKHGGSVKLSRQFENSQQPEQGFVTIAGGGNDVQQVKGSYTAPVEAKHQKISADSVVKKVKSHKRPAGDLNSDNSAVGEKRKKKKKKGIISQTSSDHLEKHSASGKLGPLLGKSMLKPASFGLAPREDFRAEQVQVDVSTGGLVPVDSIGEVNIGLPQLLGDLQALALDPFHGVERNTPAIVRKFFLRFRSLVYQKSLVLSPTENESLEARVIKSPSNVGVSDRPRVDHVKALPVVKPMKHIVRPEDPTKAGRKRAPSDRQEEIAAKRLKKIKDLKALAAEKKAASQKASEARRGEGKESLGPAMSRTGSALPKSVKADSTKKVEHRSKAVEPTMLVIKFPPKTSLPSVAELKARFARFGPMDQSGLRVFWKTSTCRVVFLHKLDAEVAYKYTEANNSLFGNVGVKCYLREMGDSGAEASEATKAKGDDGANETPQVKDTTVVQRKTSALAQQSLPQPTIQLKSCLKKSSGDESGQVTGNGVSNKGTPRVKFMLGGEDNRGEQLMVGNRNNFNSASFADGVAPSPVAMDFNSKNVQKVISQPPLPTLPPPAQFTKAPQHNLHNSEMAPRNTPNFINTTASAAATTVDISQQMISLLTMCNDVVNDLTGLLGYVPYHPL